MAKVKSVYICSSCGAKFLRWQGICPECGEAGTITETVESTAPNAGAKAASRALTGFAGSSGSGITNLSAVDSSFLTFLDGITAASNTPLIVECIPLI